MSIHLQALQAKLAALKAATSEKPTAQPATVQTSNNTTALPTPKTSNTTTAIKSPSEILKALAALQAKMKQLPQAPAQAIAAATKGPGVPSAPLAQALQEVIKTTAPAKLDIVLNERQQAAVASAMEGKAFCLIGSAGTGKTTTELAIVEAVCRRILQEQFVGREDQFIPAQHIIVCAFTRRAVRNIVKVVRKLGPKFEECCKTVHKALLYKPVQKSYINEDGEYIDRKIYKAHITRANPDNTVQVVIVDEASMLGYSKLYRELREAFPKATFIFIGDLNQLRPVMDQPTLAYALASLPVIELNHVYRQALDSPIVEFQYTFTLAGKVPKLTDLTAYNNAKKGLQFLALNWPKMQDPLKYVNMFVGNIVKPSFRGGNYNPEESVFLIPYRKEGTFGAIELNLEIAEFLGQERGTVVHEVIAGFQRRYFAEGDLVMYDRKEYKIMDIAINMEYKGKQFQQASKTLSRHGYYLAEDDTLVHGLFEDAPNTISTEALLAMEFQEEEEDKEAAVRKASHSITLQDRETGDTITVDTNKDLLEIEFSYALTIHQSQGSEWKKVYLIMHASHKNVTREMMYTGMTRAREELVVFYSKGHSVGTDLGNSSIARGIERQEIVGKTWQEKALVYKMALNNGNGDLPVDMDWFMNIHTDEDRARYNEFAKLREEDWI